MAWKIMQGDVRDKLAELPGKSVQCVVTSPPYWGLRDYGLPPSVWGGDKDCEHGWGEQVIERKRGATCGANARAGNTLSGVSGTELRQGQFCQKCGAWLGCLGLEPTPEMFVANMVEIFREVRRVLRPDGTLWLNLGDSYNGSGGAGGDYNKGGLKEGQPKYPGRKIAALKPKDLVGTPWRVAFALQADGWWLRSDIIWCLSGGTWVYAKTQKGEMPMMIKDIARLDPKTVKLWNGEKWTQLLGMSRSERKGDEIELVLRSGERISCTPTHKFPTDKGLKEAKDITIGDVLQFCRLPEPEQPRDCVIDEDAAWLAGLYIAEGSMAGDTIQIAGHTKEIERWERLQKIANKYGGSITRTIDGNKMDIRMYGKVLVAILSELVSDKTAKNKCFAPVVWRYSNKFIESMLDGYLSGDGHYEKQNDRWRLGFTRNYNLERDLRTACSRLGYRLTLNLSTVLYNSRQLPTFRGEIRKTRSGHFNEKNMGEVLEINKSRCRYVWDIGVENEPHLFALASGILTHNSKPNPMPESVTDRCTKAHEYIFLLTKKQKYFYDAEAIKEPLAESTLNDKRNSTGRHTQGKEYSKYYDDASPEKTKPDMPSWYRAKSFVNPASGRNKRSVWTISTQPYPEAHFACVDEETECLTVDGWKRYCDIKPGVVAAQYDMKENCIQWAEVEDVAIYDVVNEPIVVAQSRDVKLMLTPNHRTIISRRHPRTRQYQPLTIIRADELKPSHSIPVSARWNYEGIEPLSPEWAELLGWYVTEGCETAYKWTVEIYQSKSVNPAKVKRIEYLLNAVGAEYSKAECVTQWRGKDRITTAFQIKGFAAVKLRGIAPQKKLPQDVLMWSDRLLQRLLDGLVDGDGHRRKDGRMSFIQRSSQMADLVQGIGVRLGYATMKSRRSEGTYTVYFTKKRLLSFRGTAGEGAEIKQEAYTGKVWCPKLPAGTWVARKKGRMFITGNTFPPKLIEPCILAGTSPRACEICGSPWERVVERTGGTIGKSWHDHSSDLEKGMSQSGCSGLGNKKNAKGEAYKVITTGWQPTCTCKNSGKGRCIVLDPFAGSGTTLWVAEHYGRDSIGIELSEEYVKLIEKRMTDFQQTIFNLGVNV